LTLAKRFSGIIDVTTVGQTDPCLYGCIAGIGAAAVVTITISIFHNARYGWETLGAIRISDDSGNDKDVAYEDPTYDPERLRKAAYNARGITLFLFLALFIIWPLRYTSLSEKSFEIETESNPSLYGTAYKFSKSFFTGWVIVSLLWAWFALFGVTIYPLIEGRHLLFSWAKDLVGKGDHLQHGDEFDHHQHTQKHDTSPENGEEKQIANDNVASIDD
jgi:hypothetical protein